MIGVMVQPKQILTAVDWGSTSFRAYRFDVGGNLVDSISSAQGIKQAQELEGTARTAWFETTLFEAVGKWLEPEAPVLLSGMITSRNGWHESPYLECPVKLSSLLTESISLQCRGHDFQFLPGVAMTAADADVMRGEELQLIGHAPEEGRLFVLPGTHSKWVLADSQHIHSFRTLPTGEMFDALLNQTLIGALAKPHTDTDDQGTSDTFRDAVKTGYSSDEFLSSLFFARSGVLLDVIRPEQAHAHLSGLLIGRELREGLSLFAANSASRQGEGVPGVTLIGDTGLCAHYKNAFELVGIEASIADSDATVTSFTKLLAGNT